jgi:hypothetical protein
MGHNRNQAGQLPIIASYNLQQYQKEEERGVIIKNLHCCNGKIRIYRTIILPVVLYGCETWSLSLREKHGLRVFENRVLRRIFV